MDYKKYIIALIQAIKEKNIPPAAKVIIGIAIVYIISPIDLISGDFLTGIGLIDDAAVAAILAGIAGKIVSEFNNRHHSGGSGGEQKHSSASHETVDSSFKD